MSLTQTTGRLRLGLLGAIKRRWQNRPRPPEKYRLKTHHKVENIGWIYVLGHVGVWIVAALYFMITQWHWHLGFTTVSFKYTWDHLPQYTGFHAYVWWTDLRHNIRDVWEGLWAGLGVQSATANPLAWKEDEPGFWTTKLHLPTRDQKTPVTPLQFAFSPFTSTIAGIPGFVIGIVLFATIPVLNDPGIVIHGHSLIAQEVTLWAASGKWQVKAIGFLASYVFARWVFMKVAADTQYFFIDANRRSGRQPRWWWHIVYTPSYRLRRRYLIDHDTPVQQHSKWISFLMPAAAAIGFGLAAYGFWLFYFGPARHA